MRSLSKTKGPLNTLAKPRSMMAQTTMRHPGRAAPLRTGREPLAHS